MNRAPKKTIWTVLRSLTGRFRKASRSRKLPVRRRTAAWLRDPDRYGG